MATIPYLSINRASATPVMQRVVGLSGTQLGDTLPGGPEVGAIGVHPNRVLVVNDSIYAIYDEALIRLDAPYTAVTAWATVQALPNSGTAGAITANSESVIGLFKVFVNGNAKLVALQHATNSSNLISYIVFDVATEAVDNSDVIAYTGPVGFNTTSANITPVAFSYNNQIFFTKGVTASGVSQLNVFNPTTEAAAGLVNPTAVASTGDFGAFAIWQGELCFLKQINTSGVGNGLIELRLFTAGSFPVVATLDQGVSYRATGRTVAFVDPTSGNLIWNAIGLDAGGLAEYVGSQITGTPAAPAFGSILPITPPGLTNLPNGSYDLSLIVSENDTPGPAPASLGSPQIDLIFQTAATSGGILTKFLYADEATLLSDQGQQLPAGDWSIPTQNQNAGMFTQGFTIGQQTAEELSRLAVTDGLQIGYRIFDTGAVASAANVALYRYTQQDTVIDDDPNPQTRATIDNPSGAQAIVNNEIQGVPADGVTNTFRWRFFDEGFAVGDQLGIQLRIEGV